MAHMSSATCMHTSAPLLVRQRPYSHPFVAAVGSHRRSLHRCRRSEAVCCRAKSGQTVAQKLCPVFFSSTALWMLSQLPAEAEGTDFSQGSFSKESYYVTLGLFVLSVPGMFSVMSWHWRPPPAVCNSALYCVVCAVSQDTCVMFLFFRPLVTDQACTQG